MGLSIGLAAGGFAKGYQQGEELKDSRARREALNEDTRTKREGREREDARRAALPGIPIPGETQIDGKGYDPSAEIDRRVREATPTHHRAGLIGALGKFLDRDAAAIGAGVKPPEAAAAPQAAIPTGGAPAAAEPPLKPGETPVEEVNAVAAPRQPRMATEEDAAKYRWLVARRTGDLEGERAAAKEYFDLHIGATKKGLTFADDATLANAIGDVTGTYVSIDRDEKSGKYTVKSDDKPVATFGSRDELLGAAFAQLDRTPEAGIALMQSARQEQRQSLLANAQMAGIREQVRASRQRGALATRQDAREQGTYDRNEADRAAVDRATAFLSNPNNAVLYPEQWDAAATTLARFMPEAAKGNVRATDATGNQTSVPVNVFSTFGEQHRQAFETSPWRAVIGVAPDQNGVPRFWVKGAKPNERIPAASMSEAENVAKRIYKQPPTAAQPPKR